MELHRTNVKSLNGSVTNIQLFYSMCIRHKARFLAIELNYFGGKHDD